jgi:3-oxoacyl-[acyl-carrier-protein] synthase III
MWIHCGPSGPIDFHTDQQAFHRDRRRPLNVPIEKCHTIMQKWGYTGSACIPMVLDDVIELSKIKRGDLVVMISSGLGWNQAAAAVRWTA